MFRNVTKENECIIVLFLTYKQTEELHINTASKIYFLYYLYLCGQIEVKLLREYLTKENIFFLMNLIDPISVINLEELVIRHLTDFLILFPLYPICDYIFSIMIINLY